MNESNPYWSIPIFYNYKVQALKPVSHTLGFQFDLPYRLPTTVGEGYRGENQPFPETRRELNYSTQGEYTAGVDNIVPSTGGIPMVNLYDPIFQFKRSDHAVRY